MNKRSKNITWQQFVAILFYILIGVVCGIILASLSDWVFGAELSFWGEMIYFLGTLVIMFAAVFVQIIIHEAGHLVFGLMSGYKFSSFRINSFMWIKENGKVKFKRLAIAGTAGQCLMAPPEPVDGKIPVVLYNLGGVLMNIITGFAFLGMCFALSSIPLLLVVMLLFALIGFVLAIMNGVPMRMGTLNNDGYNTLELVRNKSALRAFWVQLKVSEMEAEGIRLKDMPDAWFSIPSDEQMKNGMIAATGVFVCNRLMDAQRFEKADKLMNHFLEINSGIVGLHRNLMICDRMYVEIITNNCREAVDAMFSKEQKKFMKLMKDYPSVMRTEYAYALLCEKDKIKADNVKNRFEKCSKIYPYSGDMQSERELMKIAEEKV